MLVTSFKDACIDVSVLKAVKKISHNASIIESFGRSPRYYDEPFLYQYFAKIRDTRWKSDADRSAEYGGGASFIEEKALIKAVCEAVERYCLAIYRESKLKKAAYAAIKKHAIPLRTIVTVSENQLLDDHFQDFRWDENTVFQWVRGFSLPHKKPKWIPAQLIYVPYNFRCEKIIRLPISTGAANGTSLNDALARGILEIIERDAFIIHYLASTYGELVDISSNKQLMQIKRYFKKYKLDLYVVHLPTDLPIYTFLSLLIDKSGIGPAVSAGLKSGDDPSQAILGSIEESWHSRPWIRNSLNTLPDLKSVIKNAHMIRDTKTRGLLWSSPSVLSYLTQWIKNKRRIHLSSLKPLLKGDEDTLLTYLIRILRNKKYSVYYVDITTPEVKKYGFTVVKVIIPQLQPLYLDEPYPYFGSTRLYTIPVKLGYYQEPLREKDLNSVPHFFL